MTNYEKIKNMTIEEMAKLFTRYYHCGFCVNHPSFYLRECYEGTKKFLESEAVEDDE